MGPNVSRQCLCTSINVPSLSERIIHTQYHILSLATLKTTTSVTHTSPTVRIVPILTTPNSPASCGHALSSLANAPVACDCPTCDRVTRSVRPRRICGAGAAAGGAGVQALAAPEHLSARRHEKACSVVRADRTRARGERLVGWRALVPVAAEDGDVESRKQRSKIMTWDRELERTCSHGTRAGMCSMEHRHRQRERVRANGWLRAYVSDAQKDVDIDSREHLVERLTWRSEIEIRG